MTNMKKLIFILLTVLISVQTMNAQISTPEKQKFNIGGYFGANVRLVKPFVSFDFSYKFVTLRVMPSLLVLTRFKKSDIDYNSLGLTFELTKLSTTFYNLYWIAGANAGIGSDVNRYEKSPSDPNIHTKYTSLSGFTGLRTYFGKRWYTNIVAGVSRNLYVTEGRKSEEEYIPYLECGIGINIWKNYPKLKAEETEE